MTTFQIIMLCLLSAMFRSDKVYYTCTSKRINIDKKVFCLPSHWGLLLTHFGLETHKRVIGKQCICRSDATKYGF